MVRFFRCSRVLADGASSSSCDTRGVTFSMPKSTSGYSTSKCGKDVVGLLLGAGMFTLLPVVFGVMCKILPVVLGLMCKILPVVFGVMCKILLIGGPAQDLSNFQMAPIPTLSVPTCSTS